MVCTIRTIMRPNVGIQFIEEYLVRLPLLSKIISILRIGKRHLYPLDNIFLLQIQPTIESLVVLKSSRLITQQTLEHDSQVFITAA